MTSPKPVYSYMAAATLAVVTLFTFFVFRDFGPQSAIRRFHADVARQDWKDFEAVSLQSFNDRSSVEMRGIVMDMVRQNASYEIVSVKRSRGDDLAVVEYRLPNGAMPFPLIWHVKLSQGEWKIDCEATLSGLRHQEPMG
jgi:hypothetical protein